MQGALVAGTLRGRAFGALAKGCSALQLAIRRVLQQKVRYRQAKQWRRYVRTSNKMYDLVDVRQLLRPGAVCGFSLAGLGGGSPGPPRVGGLEHSLIHKLWQGASWQAPSSRMPSPVTRVTEVHGSPKLTVFVFSHVVFVLSPFLSLSLSLPLSLSLSSFYLLFLSFLVLPLAFNCPSLLLPPPPPPHTISIG